MIVVTIVTALHFPVGCLKIILTGLKVSLPVALDLTLAERLTDPAACVGSQRRWAGHVNTRRRWQLGFYSTSWNPGSIKSSAHNIFFVGR